MCAGTGRAAQPDGHWRITTFVVGSERRRHPPLACAGQFDERAFVPRYVAQFLARTGAGAWRRRGARQLGGAQCRRRAPGDRRGGGRLDSPQLPPTDPTSITTERSSSMMTAISTFVDRVVARLRPSIREREHCPQDQAGSDDGRSTLPVTWTHHEFVMGLLLRYLPKAGLHAGATC